MKKKSSASIKLSNKIKIASEKLKTLRAEMKELKIEEAKQSDSVELKSKKSAGKKPVKKEVKKTNKPSKKKTMQKK